MNQEETIEILNELLKSIKSRGFRKTINVLKTQNQKEVELTDPFDVFVIESVCSCFNITKDNLLYSKYMRGENKYAIGLCVYYMYENKSLGEIHKKIFINKNKTLLSKYRQIIYDLDPNHVEDQKILAIKKDIDTLINKFKKDKK